MTINDNKRLERPTNELRRLTDKASAMLWLLTTCVLLGTEISR